MALREHLARLRATWGGPSTSGERPGAAWSIDERLEPFLRVCEVADGEFFAGQLLRCKLGASPPDIGHHMVAFYRQDDRTFLAASYLHLWTQGSIGLVGGGCTDGDVLRTMNPRELELVNLAGGLLRQTLGFCFAHFEADLEAFFGHAGDPRAREVDLAAGFTETGLPHLLVRYNRALTETRRQALVEQAHAIGPF